MTVRQSMWFFTCSTIKTVDDHCGYALPWDPIQHLTSNNAAYHDIHHQSWGIKTNFSQPFFTFWDSLLNTRWTGGDVTARYEKTRKAAQVWYETKYSKQGISRGASAQDYSTDSNDSAYEPDPYVANAIASLPPKVPKGKAAKHAGASRQQVLETAGAKVLAEEAAEEADASADSTPRRSNRRKKSSQGPALKGLKDRVEGSLNIGVPRVESSR
jgi:sphinganine C4-monooxygenase